MDPHPDARRLLRGAVAGLVSTGVALGSAELVAATRRDLRSPIFDVGARFVDHTPAWLKDFAIEQFGTNDKLALLVGIGVVLVLYGIGIGIAATRHRWVGVAGVVLFGAIGTYASLGGVHGPWAVLPTLVGTIAGAGAMWILSGLAAATEQAISTEGGAPGRTPPPSGALAALGGRRAFLAGSAALAATAAAAGGAGRWLSRRFDVAATRAGIVLPKAKRALAPVPDDAMLDVPGLTPFVTPNADFYRIDTALVVPQVPIDSWRLRVTGMVDRELTFTFDELLERDLVEADITLTCVSNEVGGRLAGNARWLGVPLEELLREAGVQDGADQIVGRSTDGYTAGFPVEAAFDGRGALVAIGMNGEPLPTRHGYPARLVTPGLYGYVSATKWLTEIELTTFERFGAYWTTRGYAVQAPIKTFSRIDTPRALGSIDAGPHPIAGVAWAQTRGIQRVEVRIDGGEWHEARLADELNDQTWRQWVLPWDFTSGRHTIECRATDGTGAIQTQERSEPLPDGATGWHSIVVIVP
ncbi:MAG: molybdopterin-dependent oxidoreductase [Actinobacteria bacterium]|nr:molybdopterin-dependent oxidoreductase [Actinomycetota bacterium]